MKRVLDLLASSFGILILSPILIPVMILVWLQDFKSPFYIAPRVGKAGEEFNMVKLRSMIVRQENEGPDSTSATDSRITPVGHFIRKTKLDELSQLWNVLVGDMSLVGPRPNVRNETDLYTPLEQKLLSVKPGITDFSSIVFSDEGEILEGEEDPDLAYNQLIRPWKSRLGLIYIDNRNLILDVQLIVFTFIAILSKESALNWVSGKLKELGAEKSLQTLSSRTIELYPFPPPGAEDIVVER